MLCSASLSGCMDHSARDLLPTDLQGCASKGFPHTALKKNFSVESLEEKSSVKLRRLAKF